MTVYTPGSAAGVPLDVIGSLAPPSTTDAEAIRDEAEAIVQGLLGLVGVTSDPMSGREHVLMANLVESAWADLTEVISYQDLAGNRLEDWFSPTTDVDYNAPPLYEMAIAATSTPPGGTTADTRLSWVEGPDWDGTTARLALLPITVTVTCFGRLSCFLFTAWSPWSGRARRGSRRGPGAAGRTR